MVLQFGGSYKKKTTRQQKSGVQKKDINNLNLRFLIFLTSFFLFMPYNFKAVHTVRFFGAYSAFLKSYGDLHTDGIDTFKVG